MSASRTTVLQGEGITIIERLENLGDRPIYHNCGRFNRRIDLLEDYVEVLQEEDDPLLSLKGSPWRRGEKVGQEGPFAVDAQVFEGLSQHEFTTRHSSVELPPGGSEVRNYTIHPHRPGVYRLRAEWTSSYAADHEGDLWRGSIPSNGLTLDVQPIQELYDRAGFLRLSLRSDTTSIRQGETLKVIGVVTNTGSTALAIARQLSSLAIVEYRSDRQSVGSGISGFRKPAGHSPLTEIAPGASMEFEAVDVVPGIEGAVKLRCGLKVYIKVDAGLFGTAIYSTCALSLAVSAPSGK